MTRLRLVVPVVFAVTSVSLGCDAARDDTGAIAEAGAVSVFSLRVGDCFDDHDPGDVQRVAALPCDEDHDNEVFATFDLAEGTWLGDDEVTRLGQEGCNERFSGAIGASYEESVLEFYPMTPTEGSWDDRDDREIVCVAYHMELAKLDRSVLGSGM
jgi:hypothetical protein